MTANRHPHIVTVLAASVQLPDASIIMEHCLHGSLSDVLARARKHPARLCWRVRLLMASDAACGLAFLHSSSNQIAHRDLNTSNLLVTEDMRVKIADFGLSRLVRAATSRENPARTAGSAGKENDGDGVEEASSAKERTVSSSDAGAEPGFGLRNCLFHAPEVIAAGAGGSFGTRADVFSFGVVLWCLATLAPPWEDVQAEHEHLPELVRFYQTMRAVADKVAAGERLPLDAVRSPEPSLASEEHPSAKMAFAENTARYAELIERCFATDPSARPSMTHALRALRRMRRDETNAEFAAFPVPKTWAGFAPVATPHMSAAFRNEPPKETKQTELLDRARERERENVRSAGNPDPVKERGTTRLSASTADRRHGAAPSLATGAHLQIALLVAAVAAASFSAGRVWSSRKA
jgi:serine/threonine-protein kinase CTR1